MTATRFDLYGAIHKALRSAMSDAVAAVGRMDADDPDDRAAALARLRAMLDLLQHHAHVEDEFIHPAVHARRAGAADRCADDHHRQQGQVVELRRLAQLAEGAGGEPRQAAAQLYRSLARFVAENLAHMDEEETAHNAVLWAEFSDGELAAINDRIVASIAPPRMAEVVRWMAPSLTPYERASLFGAIQAKAPAEVFQRLLETARQQLPPRDWNKLVAGIAAAPLAA